MKRSSPLTLHSSAAMPKLELLRACRKRTGKSPWLLIAGDAGQRVEASGFEWGRYTELLSSRWRKPATFDLHEHVRCPSRIAAVVNRSNIFYSLGRQEPPAGEAAAGSCIGNNLI